MAKSMTRDLTEGRPTHLILSFAFSMLISGMMSYVYGTTDSLMVSRYVDPDALGAISAASPATGLVEGAAASIISGFSLYAGKLFGAKDERGLRRAMAHTVFLALIIVGLATVVCTVFCRPLVLLMQTPRGFVDMAVNYLSILMMAMPISAVSWVCASMFRALGDSKTPLLISAISGLSNVGFNAFFLVGLGQGIEGAAYGTVCAVSLSAALYLFFLFRRMRVLLFGLSDMKPSLPIVKILLSNGIPLGMLNAVIALGATILQIAVNGRGEDVVTGIALGGRVLSFLWLIFQSFESAIIYFCAQNCGAGKLGRVRRGVRNTLLLNFAFGAVLSVVAVLFGKYIYLLFVGEGHDHVIEYAERYLLSQVIFFPCMVMLCCWRGAIQGLGSTVPAVLCGVIELIARVVISVFFAENLNVLFMAGPLAWVFTSIFLAILYPRVLRRAERRAAAQNNIAYFDSRDEAVAATAE